MTVTREQLVACLSVPRWADDVLAGRAVRRPDGAAGPRRRGGPDAVRRGAGAGAVGPPADRRAGRRPVAARAGRRRPGRRRHRGAAGGRQRGVRAAVRPGVPDPGRGSRRRGRSWPSSTAGSATTTRPSGPRPSTTCGRSRCCAWRRSPDGHPLDPRPRHRCRPPGRRHRRAAGVPRRRRARPGRHRRRRAGRLAGRGAGARRLRAALRHRLPTSAASTRRSSSCSPSPTTGTTTCRCCSARTATRPTVAADLVIRARRAIVAGAEVAASVAVADGRIVAVTAYDDVPDAASVVTLDDDEVLLPGLVDTHVHVNEPGRTEWEGFETATRAAAAGGVTTIVDMPLNSVPATTTVAALDLKRSVAEGQVFVDVGFWGGAVPDNLADLAPLHAAGVFGFKCFLLDSGVAEFPHLPPEAFAAAMARDGPGRCPDGRARRGRRPDRRLGARRRPLRRLPGLTAAGGRGGRDRPGGGAGAGDRRACARGAPVGRRRRADVAGRSSRRAWTCRSRPVRTT